MRKLSLLLPSLALLACGSGGLKHRLEPAAVAAIPPDVQAGLEAKTTTYQDREKEREKADNELREARFLLANARTDLELAQKRRDATRALRKIADEAKDQARADDLEKTEDALGLLVEAQESMIEWREETAKAADVKLRLTESKLLAADAERELARAEALAAAKSPLLGEGAVTEYKVQLSEHSERAAQLEAEHARASQQVDEAKKDYEEALAKVPDQVAGDKRAIAELEKERERLKAELVQSQQRSTSLAEELEKLRNASITPASAPATNPENAGGQK